MSFRRSTKNVENKEIINDISFNQDKTCIAFATNTGYFIVKVDGFQKICHRTIGSVGKIRMLFSSNILGLVGTKDNNSFKLPNNFVMLNDKNFKVLGELDCKRSIQDVVIKQDIVFCKTETTITIFNYRTDETIKVIEISNQALPTVEKLTMPPVFACAIDRNVPLICYSDNIIGEVILYNFSTRDSKKIQAHKNEIRMLQMDYGGRFIITSSTEGTLLRVYCTKTYAQIGEDKRYGFKNCLIRDISLSTKCDLIVACNSSEKVRMFNLVGFDDNSENSGRTSTLNDLGGRRNTDFSLRNIFRRREVCEWKFKTTTDACIKRANFDRLSNYMIALTDKGVAYKAFLPEIIQKNEKKVKLTDGIDL